MPQHHWLRNRAPLQGNCFLDDDTIDDKRLPLHLRYETTHERRRPQVPKRTAKNKSRKEKKVYHQQTPTERLEQLADAKIIRAESWRSLKESLIV